MYAIRSYYVIAQDGAFNSPTESGYADIPLASISGLSDGDHTIYVRAKDSSGNWGDPMAVGASTTLTVDKTGPTFGPITLTPPDTPRATGNNATDINVEVAGSLMDATGVATSGSYTITDSKSNNVITGTFPITTAGTNSYNFV